jgi:hypothetical protein
LPYFFLGARWVFLGARWDRAEPAATLAALLELLLRRTFDAAVAAFELVLRSFSFDINASLGGGRLIHEQERYLQLMS